MCLYVYKHHLLEPQSIVACACEAESQATVSIVARHRGGVKGDSVAARDGGLGHNLRTCRIGGVGWAGRQCGWARGGHLFHVESLG